MTLGMVALWALLYWAIMAVVRSGGGAAPPRDATPEQILGERLARGELDEEGYRRGLDVLRGPQPARSAAPGDRS